MQAEFPSHIEFSSNTLVVKVATDAGISDDQAQKAVESVKVYIVEQFPLLEAVIKNMFSNRGKYKF